MDIIGASRKVSNKTPREAPPAPVRNRVTRFLKYLNELCLIQSDDDARCNRWLSFTVVQAFEAARVVALTSAVLVLREKARN